MGQKTSNFVHFIKFTFLNYCPNKMSLNYFFSVIASEVRPKQCQKKTSDDFVVRSPLPRMMPLGFNEMIPNSFLHIAPETTPMLITLIRNVNNDIHCK